MSKSRRLWQQNGSRDEAVREEKKVTGRSVKISGVNRTINVDHDWISWAVNPGNVFMSFVIKVCDMRYTATTEGRFKSYAIL